MKLTRRKLLRASLTAGGIRLLGFRKFSAVEPPREQTSDGFGGGQRIGIVDFMEPPSLPLDTALGVGLDGRLFTNLANMTQEELVTPTQRFYIRTLASELLEKRDSWSIRLGGLVSRSMDLTLQQIRNRVRPMGLHLMECSGNGRGGSFGLLSCADWEGVPLSEILDTAKIERTATRVAVSGFDRYPTVSTTSLPGASWIFTLDELRSTHAFLATQMNGEPLPRDHGAPVRLVVPGWYGCTCIKWVNEITLLEDNPDASSQMQEFAGRTNQEGVPKLARDYKPAIIEQAAMPIRIEKWLVDARIRYRVVGIVWGGTRLVKVLEIRFNPEENFVPVDNLRQTVNDPWSFWTHAWTPKQPDKYLIRLRVKEPVVPASRLDRGYYVRAVEITEV